MFIAARVADAALLLGAFGLLGLFGTADLDEIGSRLSAIRLTPAADSTLFVATTLLVIAALARSAQLPFHGWLPATLAAPAPAAALLHSVSGIAVGVVLLVRLAPLLQPGALLLAAVIGGVTALLGAIVALAENDRGRAMAWSTAGHAGLMFAAVGAGAPGVALFHLLAHALAKATLLLAPDVAERVADAETAGDRREVRRRISPIAIGFASGVLGIGLLPPAATFFSALALAAAFADRPLLLAVLLVAAFLFGLQAARLFVSTFGESATGARLSRARETSLLSLIPLVLLGVGTLVFGALVAAGTISLGTPIPPPISVGGQIAVAAASLAGAALGLWSRARAPRGFVPTLLSLVTAGTARADTLVARSFEALARLLAVEGEGIVRKSVDALGWVVQRVALLAGRVESGGVRTHQAVLWAAIVTLVAYWTLR
jgi:NADH-quinone oxidoreductase subunit L